MIPHHRHHMTILSTYSPFRHFGPGLRTATSGSSDRPLAMLLWLSASLILLRQEKMPLWSRPSCPKPGSHGTAAGHHRHPCLLDRSRPLGAPNRRFLTFSDQGGPAAAEANSTPRPLGRSSQSLRGTRRLPASVYIFLHLDPAPGTNRNRKSGRCHSATSGGRG